MYGEWIAPPYEQPDGSGLTEGGLSEPAIPTVRVPDSTVAGGFRIVNCGDCTAEDHAAIAAAAAPASKGKA